MFIQTETTPDATVMRFLPGQAVAPTGPLEFADAGAAEAGSPLASRLFAIAGVAGVTLDADAISVRKEDDKDWQILKTQLLAAIMDHFTAGEPVLAGEAGAAEADPEADAALAEKVKELLDTRIRPAVADKGGDFTFHGVTGGVVRIETGGSMPGAMIAMKTGIENMLRQHLPEVKGLQYISQAEASGKVSREGLDTSEGQTVQRILDEQINPAVASHGGHITLVDVKDNKVYVELGGGCQGCGMANVTLKQGIETAIRAELPEITEVLDVTDHDGGDNPYYKPGKK